jgi:hypothetical protein
MKAILTFYKYNYYLFCTFSVGSVLYSREVDPAELLMDLGFGRQSSDQMTRIPARFFQPSKVRMKDVIVAGWMDE